MFKQSAWQSAVVCLRTQGLWAGRNKGEQEETSSLAIPGEKVDGARPTVAILESRGDRVLESPLIVLL